MKDLSSPIIRVLLLVLSCTLASAVYAEKLLFRYQDEKGRIVLNDTLPPAAVNGGYQIIRVDGRVVKTVAPAAKPGELQEAQLRQRQEEAQRQWDESLLLRYSDVEDIKAAKKRALNDITVRISILKGNLHYLKTQVEREEFRAAEAERRGQEVSPELESAIKTLKQQVSDVEELIEVRQREKEETAQRFDKDMARFAELLDNLGSYR